METSNKKTLIFGASLKEVRYSNMAIQLLKDLNFEVEAIGLKSGKVRDIDIQVGHPELKNIDTISLYVNPNNQKEHLEYFLSLNPKRIIFNPGTENSDFYDQAKNIGIDVLNACTLVLLRTGQY